MNHDDLLRADGSLDLDGLKERLGTELHDILGRHDKISAHLQNADRTMPADWSEAAQLVENDEVLEALEESSRGRIQALRGALRRIEAGTYGNCLRCGDAINPRRLLAMPSSTMCVACASQS